MASKKKLAGVLSSVEDLKTALITIALKSSGVVFLFFFFFFFCGISVFSRSRREIPTKSKHESSELHALLERICLRRVQKQTHWRRLWSR